MMICQQSLGETQLRVVKAPLLARTQVKLEQRVKVETQLELSNKQLKKKTLRRAQRQQSSMRNALLVERNLQGRRMGRRSGVHLGCSQQIRPRYQRLSHLLHVSLTKHSYH